MASLVSTRLGGPLLLPPPSPSLLTSYAYWAVKMENGTFLSERDMIPDGNRPDDPRFPEGKRPFDWGLDLVGATGEWKRVREIWLMCPPNADNPYGQTAYMPVREAGTAFQFKVGFLDQGVGGDGGSESGRSTPARLIGVVTDKQSGDCTCCIWDAIGQVLLVNWYANIYNFGTWRPEIAPIGRLEPHILGLHL